MSPFAFIGDYLMTLIDRLFSESADLRLRVIGIYGVLIVANLVAWTWALLLFHDRPVLLGTALLTYGLGLRHAMDADHIAAIDNVVRKLMQTEKRPVGVGFFFALGHSSVVVLAVAAAGTASTLLGPADMLKAVGGVVGTAISTIFLFIVAAANIVILHGAWRAWRHVRRGGAYAGEEVDVLLNKRGLAARIFRPLFRLVTKSWHMAPLGFLFGIGFESATEVALLGISATQAAQGGSLWSIMVFPALFAAGMCLVDTTDGIVMLGAYDWAIRTPIRKLYYNLTLTSISVFVALLIACIEALGLAGDQFGFDGGFWRLVNSLNDNFNTLGFVIVGACVAAWFLSVIVYRFSGREEIPRLALATETVRSGSGE
jgi:high-affinity nickel-transport protein